MIDPIKVVFFGTPDYSTLVLQKLINSPNIKVAAVVTQPDRPVGRHHRLTPSPVKTLAQDHQIPVLTLEKLNQNFLAIPSSLLGIHLFVVAAYAKILPRKLLNLPKYGALCLHPSLLPQYRGPSPVQQTILNGEKQTGVTIFQMDEKIDHGPIIAQFKEEIKDDDTSESLYQRLFRAGAEVLVTILPAYIEGRIEPRKQDHQKATYTKTLTRDDGFILGKDLKAAIEGQSPAKAIEIERKIRAFYPWPGTWTEIQLTPHPSPLTTKRLITTKRLKILKAHLEKSLPTIPDRLPKIIKSIQEQKRLVLDEVQLEGKKPVSWKQFKEGYPEAKFT